jgi:hypothetical protein
MRHLELPQLVLIMADIDDPRHQITNETMKLRESEIIVQVPRVLLLEEHHCRRQNPTVIAHLSIRRGISKIHRLRRMRNDGSSILCAFRIRIVLPHQGPIASQLHSVDLIDSLRTRYWLTTRVGKSLHIRGLPDIVKERISHYGSGKGMKKNFGENRSGRENENENGNEKGNESGNGNGKEIVSETVSENELSVESTLTFPENLDS